ncbi:hypothetical protein FRACYDRAFT_233337 [Fragilariopsis cylindrus CCMP1102]|uniref:Uncharacterized protein n=1 Tax=Fragilariopsis cylindrus CCMP1102 TaxID=635003 RepID=A0A1E7FYE6_9STRA|nr:hypothetical protein FRACYDRAFT_233337 [Fragilariopsis cylindrus CCMP1102]|eukprot:OEU23167.1 hypothetical protein FRACYDRAFT_233337 [Fragilariopsis cylindrus CCMP1102]
MPRRTTRNNVLISNNKNEETEEEEDDDDAIMIQQEDSDENDDDDEMKKKKQYVLDGIRYSNYPDFVTAKRKRNQKVLNDLGFKNNNNNNNNSKKKKKKKKKSSSSKKNSKEKPTSEKEEEEEEEEPSSPAQQQRQRRLMSSSSYYEDYYSNNDYDDPCISLSFETASHAAPVSAVSAVTRTSTSQSTVTSQSTIEIKTDPFDELSDCLLRLKQASKEEEEKEEVVTLLKKILSRVAPPAPAPANACGTDGDGDGDGHYFHRDRYLKAFDELNGMHTILQLFRSLHTNTSTSTSYDHNIEAISKSVIQILRDVLFVQQEMGLELLLLIITNEYYYRKSISDYSIITINGASTENSAATTRCSPRRRSSTRSVNCSDSTTFAAAAAAAATNDNCNDDRITINNKPEDVLKMICDVWSIYVNVTYYTSITQIMGREQILILADTAYWSITTLDYNVTNELIQLGLITPSPSVVEEEEEEEEAVRKNNVKRKGKQKKSISKSMVKKSSGRKRKSKGSSDNDDGGIIAEGVKNQKSDSSNNNNNMDENNENRITDLRPILGTIRNLIADPIITKRDWDVKFLLPKLLDVLCKEREPQQNKQRQQQRQVTLTQQQHQHQHQQVLEYDDDIIFRWTEQEENTVWNVLDVLKICSVERILSDPSDVERLVALYIRYLKKFGPSSIRIVRCVLNLVDGLLFIQQYDGGDNEGGEDTNARIPAVKAIIKRSSYKLQLNSLLNIYDCNSGHSNNNSSNNITEQNKIHEEIQTAISKLVML